MHGALTLETNQVMYGGRILLGLKPNTPLIWPRLMLQVSTHGKEMEVEVPHHDAPPPFLGGQHDDHGDNA
jgi:hypothetical protein